VTIRPFAFPEHRVGWTLACARRRGRAELS
jgi:hypothetical protein